MKYFVSQKNFNKFNANRTKVFKYLGCTSKKQNSKNKKISDNISRDLQCINALTITIKEFL